MAKQLKQRPDFNAGAFNVAFLELVAEVKKHHTHKHAAKVGKGAGAPIRPATFFKQQNKNR